MKKTKKPVKTKQQQWEENNPCPETFEDCFTKRGKK